MRDRNRGVPPALLPAFAFSTVVVGIGWYAGYVQSFTAWMFARSVEELTFLLVFVLAVHVVARGGLN